MKALLGAARRLIAGIIGTARQGKPAHSEPSGPALLGRRKQCPHPVVRRAPHRRGARVSR